MEIKLMLGENTLVSPAKGYFIQKFFVPDAIFVNNERSSKNG